MSLATYSVKCNPDMVLYLARYRCAQCTGAPAGIAARRPMDGGGGKEDCASSLTGATGDRALASITGDHGLPAVLGTIQCTSTS